MSRGVPPPRAKTFRWNLSDALQDVFDEEDAEHGQGSFATLGAPTSGRTMTGDWKAAEPEGRRRPPDCPSPKGEGQRHCGAQGGAFRFMLANAARIIDEEIERHAASFELGEAEVGAPSGEQSRASVWMVLRTDPEGNLTRGLLRIPAYSELHARYLLLLDCTQRPLDGADAAGAAKDPDYYLPLVDVLADLCQDEETGDADLLGIMDRFASVDLGAYQLVPCDNVDLCALVDRATVKRQVRFYS